MPFLLAVTLFLVRLFKITYNIQENFFSRRKRWRILTDGNPTGTFPPKLFQHWKVDRPKLWSDALPARGFPPPPVPVVSPST